MKTWMILAAAAALAPMNLSARGVSAEGPRAELVKEIEAARTALLPQAQPLPQVTVRFQPRLDEIKKSVPAAKTKAQLEKVRKDFTDWKTVVTRHLYAEAPRGLSGGVSYEKFSSEKTAEIGFVLGLRQQLSAQRVEAQVGAVRAAALRPDHSWAGTFDNSGAAPGSFAALSGSDGAVYADAPLPANDPARYDKIRALLLSKGVSPKIVDTAISEGIRQKVDPMIVLSVINQESNFKKNAHNKGSDCQGLMQLAPATAADMGVRGNLFDPVANIKAGVKYMNWIANSYFKMNLDMSDLSKVPAEKLKMVLASYNWGIGNVKRIVKKYGTAGLDRVAPKETRDYIAEIPSRIYNWFASF
jgi:soluble lytic murein transglycosylase-like protein